MSPIDKWSILAGFIYIGFIILLAAAYIIITDV